MPHLAPQRQSTLADIPESQQSDLSQQPTMPKRAVTMPVSTLGGAQSHGSTDIFPAAGSHNPFAIPAVPTAQSTMNTLQQQQQSVPPAASTNSFRNVSRESADFSFLSGRHSPDAFAGLSARVSTPRLR